MSNKILRITDPAEEPVVFFDEDDDTVVAVVPPAAEESARAEETPAEDAPAAEELKPAEDAPAAEESARVEDAPAAEEPEPADETPAEEESTRAEETLAEEARAGEERALVEETPAAHPRKPLPLKKLKLLVLVLFLAAAAATTSTFGYTYHDYIRNQQDTVTGGVAKTAASSKKTSTSAFEKTKKAIEAKIEAERRAREAKIAAIRTKAQNRQYIAATGTTGLAISNSLEYQTIAGTFSWGGAVISSSRGAISSGPMGGRETYYNLNMSTCVAIMHRMGYRDAYWVRSDGCKMLGNYIMVAANLSRYPKGTIVKCSRGYAIVVDTGGFASANPNQLDIATTW